MSRLSNAARRLGQWLIASGAMLACAALLPAQDIVRSDAAWRTLRTRWFEVHYPRDTEAWALDLAPRLDAIHDAVAQLVGYAPPGRTTIVIDDPYNVANGKAIPILGAPVVHLWVTPPGPSEQIGNHRGWGVKLAAHEFAHIAHLSRPVRRSQWYWHLVPAQVSPIAVNTPRWALEGYATWIEGVITGSGRPHSASRPALLRELALAGRLPDYAALSAGGGYKGGSMAYLAGSAFWEWLAAQRGDSSMTLVFRRQTARTARSFDDAFRGVYGDAPSTMYARFSAELTAKSFAIDSALRRAGLVEGTLLGRFPGSVGGPALSRDGRRIALALSGVSGGAPRIIVAPPDTQPTSVDERTAQERQLRRDPQDVAAIRLRPRLMKAIATLTPRRGRQFANPRFIDVAGTQLLLESWSVRRDGTQRPDLMTWNTVTGSVRRITDGAAVQDADPSPDGTRAAAIRCIGGSCDLVLLSLKNGGVRTLATGSPTTVYSHPRWSRDGTRIVAAVQHGDGQWRLAVVDAVHETQTLATEPDDVNRHSASFSADGTHLVYVSEAGGIPNVETLRLSDGALTSRTRLLGSAYEPEPTNDGGIVFLSEYAGGMDLRRVSAASRVDGETRGIDLPSLIPAMPRPRERGVPLAVAPLAASTAYGAGPRSIRFMARTAMARDGLQFGGVIASADPANRLSWTLTGLAGTTAAWRGGVASAAWYGARPHLRAEALWLEQRATAQRDAASVDAFDLRIAGGSLAAELPIAGTSAAHRLQLSTFAGAAQDQSWPAQSRLLLTGTYGTGAVVGWRRSIGASVRGAVGRLGDSSFTRASVGGYVSAFRVRLDARAHRASRGAPRLEQFSAGGFAPPISDEATLAQRIAMPAFPTGIATGREVYELRIARPAPLLPLTLFAQSVGTSWRPDRHQALAGLEQSFDLDYLGLVGLPRLRAQAGAAHIFRGSLAGRTSAYLMLGWRP
ncbi:MAG TPA: hypothetical protein VE861_15835 [Gemmatimonadaceae bacterium]|nr:hypothetical protein [Gemmatimonadaceae bacterium]